MRHMINLQGKEKKKKEKAQEESSSTTIKWNKGKVKSFHYIERIREGITKP